MDDPLIELTPDPGIPLAPVMVAARAELASTLTDLLTVPDAVLESAWRWRPGDDLDADVRYGFYRIHERLEEAVGRIGRGRMAGGEGPAVGPAVAVLASANGARWELRGAIAALDEADLDRDPGSDEWTVRQTLGHLVASQRGYGWYNAWWLDRGHVPGPLPPRAGDARLPELPDAATEAIGSRVEIMARMDALVDLAGERFATIDDAALAVPARWSGLPVDLAFRLGRLGSHIREHTIQIDKTAAMLARPTTEVERLVRLIGTSYGRLEGLLFARSAETLATPLAGGDSAADILDRCAVDIRELAASVARAAVVARPATS